MFERSLPGFTYAIDSPPGMTCIVCHGTERLCLFRKGEQQYGICEPCSSLAQWAWRQLAGEAAPGSPEDPTVSRVYVLICRRRKVPRADAPIDASEDIRMVLAPVEINSSYEFLLAEQPDGSLDLPSLACLGLPSFPEGNKPLIGAAMRALSNLALSSWEPMLEPLYTAYTPRGHLVSVVLVRAWTDDMPSTSRIPGGGRCWRSWPISSQAGALAGFWRTLENVWPLRLHKHCVQGEPEDICVQVRRAGREYISLQSGSQEDRQTDASMMLALQAGMSADEIAIARMIRLAVGRSRDEKALAALPPAKPHGRFSRKPSSKNKPAGPAPEPEPEPNDEWPELALPGGGPEKVAAEMDEVPDDDGMLDEAEPDEEGFVRPGRPLKNDEI